MTGIYRRILDRIERVPRAGHARAHLAAGVGEGLGGRPLAGHGARRPGRAGPVRVNGRGTLGARSKDHVA